MKRAIEELAVWICAGLMLAVGAAVAVIITSAPTVLAVVFGLWAAKAVGIL